jgi:hypothetical protein
MLCVIFSFSFLDRANVGAAYIAGMAKDIGLTAG